MAALADAARRRHHRGMSRDDASTAALLGLADPPPVELLRRDGAARLLILCDHASCAVPASLAGLGLDAASRRQHIGWDIGAAAVTRRLSGLLDAPAVLAGYSRLVIDCNRSPADPTAIPAVSDGVTVPGNAGLDAAARAAREAACFAPYHAAIARELAGFAVRGVVPVVLSIHSFTPVMQSFARPWHVGILWDKDPRVPVPLIAALAADPARNVGDNQPYSAREPAGYSIHTHAASAGLPHAAVEIRQDLIAEAAGQRGWAAILADALAPILARPGLHRVEHFR